MTRKELLEKYYEREMHNVFCYSATYLMNSPKKGYEQEYECLLNEVCDEKFNAVLSDLAVGASNKGVEVLHIYYDAAGELRYCITPAKNTKI